MGDFDYLAQDRALSRAESRSLVPPDDFEHVDDCLWRQGECTCPTLAELKAEDGDRRNKAALEGW